MDFDETCSILEAEKMDIKKTIASEIESRKNGNMPMMTNAFALRVDDLLGWYERLDRIEKVFKPTRKKAL